MHLGRVFLHTWLLASSCPGKQQAAASFSFPPHSQLSPDPYSTLWYSICNRNSLLLQRQMHSINGIMLILCQCQPDATTQMHPPHLHQMGRRRADGACGYSRGHLPAGISRCMHVVLLFVVSHARHPSSCDILGLCMPHFICSHTLICYCGVSTVYV